MRSTQSRSRIPTIAPYGPELSIGANGAGKSNLFKALRLLKTIATSPQKKDAPIRRDAFRFGSGPTKPTVLDLQCAIGLQTYRYGVKLDMHKCLEWLTRISHGNEQVLYERMPGPKGEVQVKLGKIPELNEKLKGLAFIGGRRNRSRRAGAHQGLEGDRDGLRPPGGRAEC